MQEIHIQVMNPTTAPSDPYVLLYAPKFAAYHEKRIDTTIQSAAASALPQVIHRHCARSWPSFRPAIEAQQIPAPRAARR